MKRPPINLQIYIGNPDLTICRSPEAGDSSVGEFRLFGRTTLDTVPEQPLERSLRADWLESGLFSLTPSR